MNNNTNDSHNIDRAIQFLKKAEGFKDTLYDDRGDSKHPNNVKTIGYGFTGKYIDKFLNYGGDRRAGDRLLEELVTNYQKNFEKHVPNWDKLNDHQKQALLVLGHGRPYFYNTKNSNDKEIMKALKQERFEDIPSYFQWGMKDASIRKGINRRYNAMANLFNTGEMPDNVYSKKYDGDLRNSPQKPQKYKEESNIKEEEKPKGNGLYERIKGLYDYEQSLLPQENQEEQPTQEEPISLTGSSYLDYLSQNPTSVEPSIADIGHPLFNQSKEVPMSTGFNQEDPQNPPYGGSPLSYFSSLNRGTNSYDPGGGLTFIQGITNSDHSVLPKTGGAGKAGMDALGKGMAAIQGITGVMGSAIENSQIKDTTSLETDIANQGLKGIGYSNNDALLQGWGNHFNITNPTYSQVGRSDGENAMGFINGIASGASAGATIGGPIGGVVGGAIGALGAGIGSLIGSKQAHNKLDELYSKTRDANMKALDNFRTSATNLENSNDDLLARAFYAFGGFL